MSIVLIFQIVLANLVATVTSLTLAAIAGVWLQQKYLQHLISLAAGTLLAMALLHLLPEAQEGLTEQGASTTIIFTYLLFGLLSFFLMERLALFRHNHHNEHDGHHHHEGFDEEAAGHGGWMILVGSGIHNLADGLLIAAAFLSDVRLGWATALTVGLHEIMHKLGDFVVLINSGIHRKRALLFTFLTGFMAVLGGILGYFILSDLLFLVPYVLVISASSFLYIAVSDLIPQMSIFRGLRLALMQIFMLFLGVAIIWFTLADDHEHAPSEHQHAMIHVQQNLS